MPGGAAVCQTTGGYPGEGDQQQLVVGLQLESLTHKVGAEMFDTKEGGQQLPVKSG